MDGFALLIGHLLGDYILQNDWMASNKTAPHPGKRNLRRYECEFGSVSEPVDEKEDEEWRKRRWRWWTGNAACTSHCLLYTLAVWACSFWWMPWWGLVACFAIHWPVDRFRLARWWMENVSGQKQFATGPLSPWSIIIVDNVFHLLTLLLIAAIHGVIR